MPFGFSLVSLDANKVAPLAVIAAAGVGGYFLYRYAQAQKAVAQDQQVSVTDASGNPIAADVSGLAEIALLQQALGGTTGGTGGGGAEAVYGAPTASAAGNGSGLTGSLPAGTTGGAAAPSAFAVNDPAPAGPGGGSILESRPA